MGHKSGYCLLAQLVSLLKLSQGENQDDGRLHSLLAAPRHSVSMLIQVVVGIQFLVVVGLRPYLRVPCCFVS